MNNMEDDVLSQVCELNVRRSIYIPRRKQVLYRVYSRMVWMCVKITIIGVCQRHRPPLEGANFALSLLHTRSAGSLSSKLGDACTLSEPGCERLLLGWR